jgi:iron complex outermembrane receptor protein
MGFRVTGERSLLKTVVLTLGAESRAGSVDAADTYYTSTDILANRGRLDIYALFAQYAFRFSNPKWQVIAGLRYDVASFYGAAFTISYPSYSIEYFSQFQFEDVAPESWQAINPKFILEYTPGAYFRHFLSLAKGFRAPVLDDLCRTARTSAGLRAANPFLKPEHVYQLELGSDIRLFKKISLELSGYHTIGDQFMHPLSNGDSVNLGYTIAPVFQVTNIARVNISGVEIDLNAPLSQRLTLRGNYTLTKAVIGSFVPFTLADHDLTGKFLANIPIHRASFEARLIVERVHLSAVMRYTGSRWIRDDNGFDNIYLMADKFKPNWVLDVKATRSFGQMKASVEAQNLMNTVYINNRGYLSPGRMVFLKLEYDMTRKNSRE